MDIIYYHRTTNGKEEFPAQTDALWLCEHIASMEQAVFSDAWTEVMLQESLSKSYNHLWTAQDDGVLCGYLLANLLGDETELLRVAVDGNMRKKGIGQQLLFAYTEFAKKECARGLLEVRHGNLPAKKMYEKNGYHLLTTRKRYYRNPEEDADIYEIVFMENGEMEC